MLHLDTYIKACVEEQGKVFTATLKRFDKEIGGYALRGKDAVTLFLKLYELYGTADEQLQLNILKLAKYTVSSSVDTMTDKMYEKIWEMIESTLEHKNGNIRQAGFFMLDRFHMSFEIEPYVWHKAKRLKKSQREELKIFLSRIYGELLKREERYIKKHADHLDEEDVVTFHGNIPFSFETRDRILMNIRRSIEMIERGSTMEEFLRNEGYTPRSVFSCAYTGRYDAFAENDTMLPALSLKYFRPASSLMRVESEFICAKCAKESRDIGSIQENGSAPFVICEACAIEEYQFEHGFSTPEIAASHRRRLFDVGYLFIEMVTNKYLYEKRINSFEALDEVQHIGLREKALTAYLALSDHERYKLENMESQTEIEEELKKILKNVEF